MAEYGTYRIYNQLLDINPNSSIIKINEEDSAAAAANSVQNAETNKINSSVIEASGKNEKVGLKVSIILILPQSSQAE